MFKVEFKDAYGEAMQPIEAASMAKAIREAERLERLGYLEIFVTK